MTRSVLAALFIMLSVQSSAQAQAGGDEFGSGGASIGGIQSKHSKFSNRILTWKAIEQAAENALVHKEYGKADLLFDAAQKVVKQPFWDAQTGMLSTVLVAQTLCGKAELLRETARLDSSKRTYEVAIELLRAKLRRTPERKQMPNYQLLQSLADTLTGYANMLAELHLEAKASAATSETLLLKKAIASEIRLGLALQNRPHGYSNRVMANIPDLGKADENPTTLPAQDVDFAPYMVDTQRRIRCQWFPLNETQSSKTVVAFRIHKRGQIGNLHLEMPSRSAILNEAPLAAIENAAFLPLPDGAPDEVDFQFTFAFNPKD